MKQIFEGAILSLDPNLVDTSKPDLRTDLLPKFGTLEWRKRQAAFLNDVEAVICANMAKLGKP